MLLLLIRACLPKCRVRHRIGSTDLVRCCSRGVLAGLCWNPSAGEGLWFTKTSMTESWLLCSTLCSLQNQAPPIQAKSAVHTLMDLRVLAITYSKEPPLDPC